MDGDRPIRRREDDRLGFSPVAESLAQVIVDEVANDGLVFGIEGKWGSGKSTLVNLTVDFLRRRTERLPEIIEFSPWLVGARDDLLHHLFDELAISASRIDPVEVESLSGPPSPLEHLRAWVFGDAHRKLRRKERLKRQLGKKLKVFGDVAGGLSKAIKLSGAAGVPYADPAGAAVERVGDVAKELFSSKSLAARKAELVAALRLLSRKIVIFVDDLDRLDPREASEVLRLIRAVADFPNVIYVLSFDPQIVASTLQRAVQVDNGSEYLEKIIQVSFRVPRPEAFDLRRWFQEEVNKLFQDELAANTSLQMPQDRRLSQAIDIQGGRYLETPRDIVRALNSLRLHAVPVRNRVDIADMVWLQLVRLGSPSLYAWIEEYLVEASAVYRGASIQEHAAERMGERLEKIFFDEHIDVDLGRYELNQMMPGISPGFGFGSKKDSRRVYNGLSQGTFQKFIRDRRLGSPEHYRLYFAFEKPAGALSDDEVEVYIALAEHDVPTAIERFSQLAVERRPQGGVMAEVLIERLLAMVDQIRPEAVPGIFASLGAALDDVARSSPTGDFGHHRAWDAGENLVERLMKRVSPPQRESCLRRLFVEGASLGWLTNMLRSETFAHGHFGGRSKAETEWLLSKNEFDSVLGTMLNRYAEAPTETLLNVPSLLNLLFAWMQGANNDAAKNWARSVVQSDAGLVQFLSKVRGWSNSSSHGVRYPLNRKDLEYFIDTVEAEKRLRRISADHTAAPQLRDRASELLAAFQQGDDSF